MSIRHIRSRALLCAVLAVQLHRSLSIWFEDAIPSGSEQTLLSDVPPPRPPESDWPRTDEILARFWTSSGYSNGILADDSQKELTYGEVTALGVRQLVHSMTIDSSVSSSTSARGDADRNVIFYDLGSGVGRLVAQVKLDNRNVHRSIGVELCPTRHSNAVASLERLSGTLGNEVASGIEYLHGNALEVDFSEATHVFISSLCFPRAVTEELQRTILERTNENLEVVAALTRLRLLESAGWQLAEAWVRTSWGEGHVRLYRRPVSI